jgi:hypothetical protein
MKFILQIQSDTPRKSESIGFFALVQSGGGGRAKDDGRSVGLDHFGAEEPVFAFHYCDALASRAGLAYHRCRHGKQT